MTKWSVDRLSPDAKTVSASRRTDIPAYYGEWFSSRLAAGYADYIPRGPQRRCRCSLLPKDVTHLVCWSKNSKPFLPVLRRVRENSNSKNKNTTPQGLASA
jgi:hypothetical protein